MVACLTSDFLRNGNGKIGEAFGPAIQTKRAGFFAKVLPVLCVQDLDTSKFAADRAVKVGGGIMRVNHSNFFRVCEAYNFPEKPRIHAGFFSKGNHVRCFACPGTRFFQTANDEPEFLGGILDKIQDDSFQSAHAQTEHDLHHGFRQLHEVHTRQCQFACRSVRDTSGGRGNVRKGVRRWVVPRDGTRVLCKRAANATGAGN